MKKYSLLLVLITFLSACTQNREATPKEDSGPQADLEVNIDAATYSSGGIDVSEPSLTVAGELDFGVINNSAVSSSVDRILRIRNTSGGAITIETSLPSTPAPFSIKYNRCPISPATLDDGASCFVSVRAFGRNMPDNSSSVTKQLTITAGANQVDVDLIASSISGGGTIAYTGDWSLTLISGEWSSQYEDAYVTSWGSGTAIGARPSFGSDSFLTFSFQNTSTQIVPAGAVTSSISYPYIMRSNRCLGKSLKPGEICDITVMFIGWRDLDLLVDGALSVKMSQTATSSTSWNLSTSHASLVRLEHVYKHPRNFSVGSLCSNGAGLAPQLYNDSTYGKGAIEGADGNIYFAGCDESLGTELYKLNTTTNEVELIHNVATDVGASSNPSSFAQVGNLVFFSAISEYIQHSTAPFSYPDYELISLDTTNNTLAIHDLKLDGDPSLGEDYYSNPYNLVSFNNKLFFSYSDMPGHGSTGDLYEYNTVTNTIGSVLHDFNTSGNDEVGSVRVIGGNIYLTARKTNGFYGYFKISPPNVVTEISGGVDLVSVDSRVRVATNGLTVFKGVDNFDGLTKFFKYDGSTVTAYNLAANTALNNCGSDFDFYGTSDSIVAALQHPSTLECDLGLVISDSTVQFHTFGNYRASVSDFSLGYFTKNSHGQIFIPFTGYQEDHTLPPPYGASVLTYSGSLILDEAVGLTFLEKNNQSSTFGGAMYTGMGLVHSSGDIYYATPRYWYITDPVFQGGADIYKISQ